MGSNAGGQAKRALPAIPLNGTEGEGALAKSPQRELAGCDFAALLISAGAVRGGRRTPAVRGRGRVRLDKRKRRSGRLRFGGGRVQIEVPTHFADDLAVDPPLVKREPGHKRVVAHHADRPRHAVRVLV